MPEPHRDFFFLHQLCNEAEEELIRFTRNVPLAVSYKADKTVVTECDSAIDAKISSLIGVHGFPVVSEEGEQSREIVIRGTYWTVDPIDGTREYIDYVNEIVSFSGSSRDFLTSPTAPARNFCFLAGLVQNGKPVLGCCYNYVTKEKIFIDVRAQDIARLWAKTVDVRPTLYTDPRVYTDSVHKTRLESIINRVPGSRVVVQGSFGLNALHALLNEHEDALVFHPFQQAGLWDVLPAAAASALGKGMVFDGQGEPLKLDSYVVVPGPGLYVLKGEKFRFVVDEL